MTPSEDKKQARKARMVSIVIAGAMLIWLGVQFAGKRMGLDGSFALLVDFAALAAFAWSFVVIYQIWRARQGS
ncbi:MAG: sulfite exporter TauE/SafE [Halocynthiibacter sp.]|jgi:sulfite exporter TauE/SafE